MKSSSFVVTVAILAFILLGEAALLMTEWGQWRALQSLSLRNETQRSRVHETEQRAGSLRAALKRAQDRAAERKNARAEQTAAAAARTPGRNEMAHRSAEALLKSLDDPAFRAALGIVDRAWNVRMAGAFLRGLGLDQQQMNHMLDLMGQMMIAKMDANQSSTASDLNPQSRAALIAQTQQDITAQIQAFLGDDKFAAYQQFNRELGVRTIAGSLQNSLSYTSAPLTDAQSQQLADAMYQTIPAGQKPDASGMGAMVPMGGTQPSPISQAQLQAAKSILSDQQMAALQAMYNGQQAMRAVQRSGGF